MGQVTTLSKPIDMYNVDSQYDFDTYTDPSMLNNKLFATFTGLNELDELIISLSSTYTIMYNKMFVLYVKSTDEYVVTYNVEQGNISNIPSNTILVHRKKDYNVLYTINALNELIKKLNGGVVDSSFPIDWQHYRNSILLTNQNELKQLNTKIYKIVEL
jgi:hypothetical protein